jgi:hypothetical protein
MSSTMYGFIACSTDSGVYNHCVEVIEQLPESGQMVVKHLFHVIPCSRSFSYYMNMITFGIDQKNDWCVDLEFLTQFEALLVKLDWKSAELIHTWTGTRVVWGRHTNSQHKYLPSTEFTRTAYGSTHDLAEIEI